MTRPHLAATLPAPRRWGPDVGGPYDQACRYLARWYALELLAWLLRLSPGDFIFERWLDTRSAPFPGEAGRTRDRQLG